MFVLYKRRERGESSDPTNTNFFVRSDISASTIYLANTSDIFTYVYVIPSTTCYTVLYNFHEENTLLKLMNEKKKIHIT